MTEIPCTYCIIWVWTSEWMLFKYLSENFTINWTWIVFLNQILGYKSSIIFHLTLAHSIIQAKQNVCSQFSGIPTSCLAKFSIHIAHCSVDGIVSGIVWSVDMDSESLLFWSCSRCRDRVVYKKWQWFKEFFALYRQILTTPVLTSWWNEKQCSYGLKHLVHMKLLTLFLRRYFLGCWFGVISSFVGCSSADVDSDILKTQCEPMH